MNNPNQLRDLISQAVSSQLQMHNIRKNKGRVNIDEDYEDDFVQEEEQEKLNQTSRTMQEEEARTKAEQAETKRQMFINVQPYVA